MTAKSRRRKVIKKQRRYSDDHPQSGNAVKESSSGTSKDQRATVPLNNADGRRFEHPAYGGKFREAFLDGGKEPEEVSESVQEVLDYIQFQKEAFERKHPGSEIEGIHNGSRWKPEEVSHEDWAKAVTIFNQRLEKE